MADAEIIDAVKGGLESIGQSKTVVGALAFMAPELIKRGDGTNRIKCDVWSIGAILYFLLFGEYPFGNELAAIQNILNGKYPDRSAQVNGSKLQFRSLIKSLWEITRSCLKMSVDDRPSALDVVKLFSSVTYSGAPRALGRVKYISQNYGSFGFILPDEGADDVFFHFDSFFGERPTNGIRVTYSSFPGSPQSRAFPVVPCKI